MRLIRSVSPQEDVWREAIFEVYRSPGTSPKIVLTSKRVQLYIFDCMRRHSKAFFGSASFFVVFIPLFFVLFLCYCLSDADIFGSPAFEAPDLMSEPACSLGNEKFLVMTDPQDLRSVLHYRFFHQFPPVSFQISSLDLTNDILRC